MIAFFCAYLVLCSIEPAPVMISPVPPRAFAVSLAENGADVREGDMILSSDTYGEMTIRSGVENVWRCLRETTGQSWDCEPLIYHRYPWFGKKYRRSL